jgi:hypothetical protein
MISPSRARPWNHDPKAALKRVNLLRNLPKINFCLDLGGESPLAARNTATGIRAAKQVYQTCRRQITGKSQVKTLQIQPFP